MNHLNICPWAEALRGTIWFNPADMQPWVQTWTPWGMVGPQDGETNG